MQKSCEVFFLDIRMVTVNEWLLMGFYLIAYVWLPLPVWPFADGNMRNLKSKTKAQNRCSVLDEDRGTKNSYLACKVIPLASYFRSQVALYKNFRTFYDIRLANAYGYSTWILTLTGGQTMYECFWAMSVRIWDMELELLHHTPGLCIVSS